VSSGGSRQARAETAVCARLSHRAHTRTLNPLTPLVSYFFTSGLLVSLPRCLSHAGEVQQRESWCVRCSSSLRALFGVVAADMWKACRARWSRRRHPARREQRWWASRTCCPGSSATTWSQGPLHQSVTSIHTYYYTGAGGLGPVASAAVCASHDSTREPAERVSG